MKLYHRFIALVVLIASCSLHNASAHSTHPPPLKRATSPATIALEILPRHRYSQDIVNLNRRSSHPAPHTLRFDDSFRLTIAAFDETFHLHLRPNSHLIHPAARVNYYGLDSAGAPTLLRTEPLLREHVKAYLGEVVAPHHSPTRMREDTAGVVPQPHPADLGWARIVIHHQGDSDPSSGPCYEGAFSANGVIYHIATKENYLRKKRTLDADVVQLLDDGDDNLVIWKDSDVMTLEEEHLVNTGFKPTGPLVKPATCAHDSLPYNADPDLNPAVPKASPDASWLAHLLNPAPNATFFRRDDAPTGSSGMGTNFQNFIGQTTGCPTSQKVIYMGVAADCEYVQKSGSQDAAKTGILTTWNTASALYKSTFNVSLGITTLNVQDPTCPQAAGNFPWNVPCASAPLNTRLSLFSAWRGTVGDDGNGLWHLMSGCPTGAEVGIAWLGTLCQNTATGTSGQIVSGAAVSTSGITEWQVVAHEIGHNFGAIHDCADGCAADDSNCCPLTATTCDATSRFIMSPVAQSGERVFSQCSLGNICALMQGVTGGKTDTSCLLDPDPNRSTISLQMCGNGIVERGEDCDPGLNVTSACCDASTCKFKNNAVCDPDSSACCTAQCTFAPNTQVCRPSKDAQCDTQEVCTGNSSACPADVVVPNGQSCGSNGLQCASGLCTSIAQQCSAVGASMNLTQACPDRNDQSCQISCKDPTSSNVCIRLTSLLIDGSPCGYGGSCLQGKCRSAGLLATIKAWYRQNLQIAIPVTIVAVLIILLFLWGMVSCLRRCCGPRSRNVPVVLNPATGMSQHTRLHSIDGGSNGLYRSLLTPSRSQYTRVPPLAAHDRARSGQDADTGYNYNANNRANWVDDRKYNGGLR